MCLNEKQAWSSLYNLKLAELSHHPLQYFSRLCVIHSTCDTDKMNETSTVIYCNIFDLIACPTTW